MKMLILTRVGALYYGEYKGAVFTKHKKKFLQFKEMYWKRHSKKHDKDLKTLYVNEQWINHKTIRDKMEIEIDDFINKTYKELLGLFKCSGNAITVGKKEN